MGIFIIELQKTTKTLNFTWSTTGMVSHSIKARPRCRVDYFAANCSSVLYQWCLDLVHLACGIKKWDCRFLTCDLSFYTSNEKAIYQHGCEIRTPNRTHENNKCTPQKHANKTITN